MRVGLLLCYARSGGTLLNQMIGSLPNVVMLSEVSPYGGGGGGWPVSHRLPRPSSCGSGMV